MAAIKTTVQDASVAAFLDAVEPERRRDDGRVVAAMIERIVGEPPKMWGPSIIGFGSYRYTYDSGHSGEMCALGFSPRKAKLVLYLGGGVGRYADKLTRLGKHATGKGCIYINRLDQVDMGVLEEMVVSAWAYRQGDGTD